MKQFSLIGVVISDPRINCVGTFYQYPMKNSLLVLIVLSGEPRFASYVTLWDVVYAPR
jgi:hypothetical protein